ncbi:MAG: hypothetical protein JNM52_02415 [Betaproteobacteria bacterium]|nr:hypothetical protein [Betaproteobacteria bacterium]
MKSLLVKAHHTSKALREEMLELDPAACNTIGGGVDDDCEETTIQVTSTDPFTGRTITRTQKDRVCIKIVFE